MTAFQKLFLLSTGLHIVVCSPSGGKGDSKKDAHYRDLQWASSLLQGKNDPEARNLQGQISSAMNGRDMTGARNRSLIAQYDRQKGTKK